MPDRSAKPVFEPFFPLNPFSSILEYWTDSFQRTVLFWDVMRKRGNQAIEHAEAGEPPVLSFRNEVVIDGRTLERPCNYMLLRILPNPESGVRIDPAKRPFVVVDPRAGHGPGIGGFKPDSQIGNALEAGHPCYFISFLPEPVPGQTLGDVASAEAAFIERVHAMHLDAEGKPCVIANCQAGWAMMAMGALHPDLMGPMIIAGSPLSYWAGVKGQNPMRYTGGLSGGTWMTALSSDLGNGRFDGSLLVSNFERLNPSHTYWSKPYNLYSKIDTEEQRYLEFEKWWSGFFLLNGEEIQAITDELFVGNKLSTGQIVTKEGQRVDLRNIRSPILVFASFGDNITPPQQALGWILDLYDSVDDIRSREQTIIYNLHHDIGHLGIFVSGKIARKETAEFVENIDLVDLLPPGLYELIIEPKGPDTVEGDLIVGNYVTRFEPRTLDDIRAFGVNDTQDDLRFATVARISDISLGLYDLFLRPWVRAMTTEAGAQAMRRMSSHRSKYYMLSDLNPAMQVVKAMAESVRQTRRPAPDDNPYLKGQNQASERIVQALDTWRDMRDATYEAFFMNTYGSPVLQALVGLHRPGAEARPRRVRDEAFEALVRRRLEEITSRVAEGGSVEALVRILIQVRESGGPIDERGFQMLRRIGKERRDEKRISLDRFRQILKEQVFLMELDRERAVAALPKLVPAEQDRRSVVEAAQQLLDVHGTPHPDELARLHQIKLLLNLEAEPAGRATHRQAG
ncbi:DUF3141 domain-containing protein [Skermanella aerolata]|uniref:DUF3141 domain-containing protein n=1 Tax=Skermanella aerolata TaxID=393310 RepID=UPI003D1E2D60